MSNMANLQAQIHKLSQELLEAEKKMSEANLKYNQAYDRYMDDTDLLEGNEELQGLRIIADAMEANYDAIEDEIFDLQADLEDMFAEEHSREEEPY